MEFVIKIVELGGNYPDEFLLHDAVATAVDAVRESILTDYLDAEINVVVDIQPACGYAGWQACTIYAEDIADEDIECYCNTYDDRMQSAFADPDYWL